MHAVEWNERYSVGIEELDTQHRRLFEIFSILLETESSHDVADALKNLRIYTHVHFDLEEKYMAECSYPDLESHRLIHGVFRKKVDRLCSVKQEGNFMEILSSLYDWLVTHVCSCDQRYTSCLINRPASVVQSLQGHTDN